MGWFGGKEKKADQNLPNNMTPIEAVTHLCASIQLADGQSDYEEREVWLRAISELFPQFSEERADRFLGEAQIALNSKVGPDRINYVVQILIRIKSLLSDEQVQLLGPKLSQLIEADGIVMTSEMEIARLVETHLGISISVDEEI